MEGRDPGQAVQGGLGPRGHLDEVEAQQEHRPEHLGAPFGARELAQQVDEAEAGDGQEPEREHMAGEPVERDGLHASRPDQGAGGGQRRHHQGGTAKGAKPPGDQARPGKTGGKPALDQELLLVSPGSRAAGRDRPEDDDQRQRPPGAPEHIPGQVVQVPGQGKEVAELECEGGHGLDEERPLRRRAAGQLEVGGSLGRGAEEGDQAESERPPAVQAEPVPQHATGSFGSAA